MKAIDLLNSANKAYNIDFEKGRKALMKEFDNRKYGKTAHLHEWKKMKRTDAKYCKECGIIRSESFIKSHNKE